MKNKASKIICVFVETSRKMHVKMTVQRDAYMSNPRQRCLVLLGAAVAFGGVMFAAPTLAQNGGFASMGKEGAAQASSLKKSAGEIFAGLAVAFGGYGGMQAFKKSKEGEQSRVTIGQIVGPLVAGAVLGATSAVMLKAGETVGLQASQQGVVQ